MNLRREGTIIKILNLYAGLGGNRKFWGDEHHITAVEINPEIAYYYTDHYPKDLVLITDCIEYLETNDLDQYDFIWASPPCQTHGRPAIMYSKYVPRMTDIYGVMHFLRRYFTGLWVIENVVPWYKDYVPKHTIQIGRHLFWANFIIPQIGYTIPSHHQSSFKEIAEWLKMDIPNIKEYRGNHDPKTQTLRNCVHPDIGKYILDCAMKKVRTLEYYTIP